MELVDRTLLRLTDQTERSALLTPAVGDRLFRAAFVFSNVEVGQVTGVTVRDIELLPAVPDLQRFDATFAQLGESNRWETFGTLGTPRGRAAADARIEVLLTTETRVAETSIESVKAERLDDLADLGRVDARIVAEDGSLPAAAGTLATRRFTALRTMLLERFTQPADFDVDAFLETRGLDSIDSLVTYLSAPRHPERLELEMVIDGTLPSRVRNHRVVAAVKVGPDPVSHLREAVEEIRVARSLLEQATEAAVPPSGMTARSGLPFLLMFPATSLDDNDLPLPAGSSPGSAAARRDARLRELQRRLEPTGIALATIPT